MKAWAAGHAACQAAVTTRWRALPCTARLRSPCPCSAVCAVLMGHAVAPTLAFPSPACLSPAPAFQPHAHLTLQRPPPSSPPRPHSLPFPLPLNRPVYILDTGARTSHQDFRGRVGEGTSLLGGSNWDDNGHGTHVAGIAVGGIHGVARNAILHAVKAGLVLLCRAGWGRVWTNVGSRGREGVGDGGAPASGGRVAEGRRHGVTLHWSSGVGVGCWRQVQVAQLVTPCWLADA